MKEIADYTKEEVLELSDEQIHEMVDYQCAVQGVPLIEAPAPVMEEMPPKDLTVFEVAGFSFERESDAQEIVDLIAEKVKLDVGYDYGYGYDNTYVKGIADACPAMRRVSVYSFEQFEKLKEEIKSVKERKDKYEKLKGAFDKADRKRSDIREEIMEVVYEIQREHQKEEEMRYEFIKYMNLAEDNPIIAMNFLRRAYPGIEKKLVESLCPRYFGDEAADPEETEEEEEE